MKKITKQKPQEEQSIDILKRLAKRVEEATVDIHDMRFDLKSIKLRLSQVESNTEIMKVDVEKMRTVLEGVSRSTDDLMEMTAEILKKAITLDEHNALSQRVRILEQS